MVSHAAIAEILSRYPGADFALIFGSTARGENGPTSDIDIAVGPAEMDVLSAQLECRMRSVKTWILSL
jgi:predicted nucleotidyltransferase